MKSPSRLPLSSISSHIPPQIAAALQTKVSRERIGSELEGMVTGPRPFHARCLLHRLNLLEPVFGASLDWEAALSTADLAWQGLEEAQVWASGQSLPCVGHRLLH